MANFMDKNDSLDGSRRDAMRAFEFRMRGLKTALELEG